MQAKRKVPRASFSITILDDEDYRLLMSEARGAEHFGAFVAICIVGRQRLLDKRAHQVPGTDALCIDNSIAHVLSMAHVTRKQFDAMVKALAAVSSEAKSQAWLYVDDQNRIVIRSFFKFNTDANWGGPRDGAGRKNQDDSICNQDDSSAATCFPSVSSSSSISSSSLSLESERERDAGAKIPLTSMSTVPDDDPVVDRPRDTQSLDGPIGQNTAEAVREALTAARQVDPEGVLELRLPYWLTKFPARFVTESIWKGKGKGTPSSYVARIIDRGLPPGWAEREAAASKPPKLRPEDVILRAPDYVREAAMARMKRNVS